MKKEKKITREVFNSLGKRKKDQMNLIYSFLKRNPNYAFSIVYLMNKFNLKKTQIYDYLIGLRNNDLVETKKRYVLIKRKGEKLK